MKVFTITCRNPATFLHAYTCLPLAYATRQAAGAILQDVADSGVLFAILMCRHKVLFISSLSNCALRKRLECDISNLLVRLLN